MRGVRVVTNVGRNAVDVEVLETCSADADGEVVWSWRADAGVQVRAKLQRLRTGDGGKRWFTGESAYKP
jgi:hypothetical protein